MKFGPLQNSFKVGSSITMPIIEGAGGKESDMEINAIPHHENDDLLVLSEVAKSLEIVL